ncbi:hypothetical protein E2562_030767 [Oryza meyeriana var. granulata]|uniref:RING-type domain-containing protein n=1 Tax=Oryza meyeriana var. granulata TaxID=110450 RepID=A0A6G1CA97_9ORYZ|nr:hypothetical protein E2562_030767 [Oryza meyeriana var. granulata]
MASNNGNSGPYPYYRNNNTGDHTDNTTVVVIMLSVVFVILFLRLIHFIINQSDGHAPAHGGTAPSDRLGAGAGTQRLEGGGVPGLPVGLLRPLGASAGTPMVCPPPPCTSAYRKDDGWQETACPVCLADFADGETIRLLPECMHYFHAACIDEWLRTRATCPLCRAAPDAAV